MSRRSDRSDRPTETLRESLSRARETTALRALRSARGDVPAAARILDVAPSYVYGIVRRSARLRAALQSIRRRAS